MTEQHQRTELFVARFGIDDRDRWAAACERLLAPDELQRAARIKGPDERVAHVIGRAMLRLIGATVSGLTASAVEIENRDGRPVLRQLPRIRTNITHTGRLVVLAVCDGFEIGVDAEAPFVPGTPLKRLADRLFAPEEADRFRALTQDRVEPEFLRYWTLKEAIGKAVGEGIVPALAGAVLRPDGDGVALSSVWCDPDASQWSIYQLPAPGGKELIAVAIAAPDVELDGVHLVALGDLASGRLRASLPAPA